MSARVYTTILGYLIPFAIIAALFFSIEILLEILFTFIRQLIPGVTRYIPIDVPGPMNLIALAINNFPTVWDLTTGIFYGATGSLTLFFFVIFVLLDILIVTVSFRALRDLLRGTSQTAIDKSREKLTSPIKISYRETLPGNGGTQPPTVDLKPKIPPGREP